MRNNSLRKNSFNFSDVNSQNSNDEECLVKIHINKIIMVQLNIKGYLVRRKVEKMKKDKVRIFENYKIFYFEF